jgi:lysophospholipase L1-like esterase
VRRFLKFAVAACSVGLALLAVEFLLLRGVLGLHGIRDADIYAYDPELGWALRPNVDARSSSLEFAYTISTDRLGLRRAGPGDVRQSAARRILIVGDSFAFGWGVSGDEMLSSRLERALGNSGGGAAVLTAGVPGYSTDQDYLSWKRLDAQLDPAVVIVLMGTNDPPADNASTVRMGNASYSKPRFRVGTGGTVALEGTPVPDKQLVIIPTLLEPIKARARTLAAYALAKQFRDARQFSAASAPPPQFDAAALGTTAAILGAFNRDAQAHGAALLVVLIPGPTLSAPLAAICRDAGIAFLDLTPRFAGHDDLTFKYDGHWNAQGHQAAADVIAPVVRAMLERK